MGRNNKQNDELSSRVAKAGDVWMHARGCPGAHVLLRTSVTNRSNHSVLLICVVCCSCILYCLCDTVPSSFQIGDCLCFVHDWIVLFLIAERLQMLICSLQRTWQRGTPRAKAKASVLSSWHPQLISRSPKVHPLAKCLSVRRRQSWADLTTAWPSKRNSSSSSSSSSSSRLQVDRVMLLSYLTYS